MRDEFEDKKVSVLIPTFNRVELLAEALDSALSQSYENIEVCVSDNASTDGSWQLILEYCSRYPNIKAVRQIRNIGPVRNWRACLDLATGEYAKIIFSDDLISRGWIESAVNLMSGDDNCGVILSPAVIGEKPFEGNLAYSFSLDCCRIPARTYLNIQLRTSAMLLPVSPGAMMFRTADLDRNLLIELDGVSGHNFNENGAGVDLLISCLTSLSYPHITFMPNEHAFFRHHSGSFTIENSENKVSVGYGLARQWLINKMSATG